MKTAEELQERMTRLELVRNGLAMGDLATIRASLRVLKDMDDEQEEETERDRHGAHS